MHGKFTTTFAVDRDYSARPQFHHLRIPDRTTAQIEPEQGAHAVETLLPGGSGIEVDPAPALVGFDHQDMRMSAHEDVRAMLGQPTPDSLGITAWAPPDVGHPNDAAFPLEVLMFREIPAYELVVDVAMHREERSLFGEGVCHPEMSDVACMPDFITSRKVMQDSVIDVSMGVTEQTDAHGGKFAQVMRLAPSWRSTSSPFMKPMFPLLRLLFLLFVAPMASVFGQPDARLHTESKKAIKLYRRAMEISREAMVSPEGRDQARGEVEDDLLKALELDPGFAEAERVLAALRFDEGRFRESRDHYAHYLAHAGEDWIRDHLAWAEAARHALDPEGMKEAMVRMRAIPGVMEGPDVELMERIAKDAEFMAEALKSPVAPNAEALPAPVSTLEDEYFPSIWLAGEALVFTRRVTDPRWDQGQEDLFVTRKSSEGWGHPQPLQGLNTLDNEGAASLSGDGRSIVFTTCREADRPGQGAHRGSCDLYSAYRFENTWSSPENLGPVNSSAWESQPCLSPDARQLYFTRGAGRAGSRKYDLFTARRKEDGTWGDPFRMGGGVNSSGKEMRPFIHPDGRHLYFASDGRTGMGGMDLFVCTLDAEGRWGMPVNLGWPINTPDDETGLVVASDGVTAYFSREVEGQLDLHVLTLPAPVAADPTAAMEGRLTNSAGRPLAQGRITLLDRATGVPFAEALATTDGTYHVPVPLDRPFAVMAEAPGHLFQSERIETGTLTERTERNFRLEPMGTGLEVVLQNVFFSSGSAELGEESLAELQRVGQWLAAQPGVRMEVGGHTDDVGAAADNLALSDERAARVLEVLLSAGAARSQLTSKGYGQSQPAVDGTTDGARQQNRRTTLRVIEVD